MGFRNNKKNVNVDEPQTDEAVVALPEAGDGEKKSRDKLSFHSIKVSTVVSFTLYGIIILALL